MNVGEAFVTIRPQTAGFEKEAQAGIAGPMKKLAFGVAGAFAAVKVKDFLGGAIGEAKESIRVAAQTAQVIKTTGSAAGLTAKEFESLAGSISKKVGIDDEAIQSSENLLATFTSVRNEAGKGNKVFSRATQAIVDMSAVQGELQGNTLLVGKALQDPVLGMAALQRVGVRLSDTQKQQIKDFAAVGDKASAQTVILKELETQFGGQAAAQATAAQKASVAWGNFQEQIGEKLIPVINGALDALMSIGNFVSDNKSLFVALGIGITAVLVPAFVAWAVAAGTAALATIAAAAPVIAIGAAIAAVAYVIIKNWDSIKGAFSAAFDFIKGLVSGLIDVFKKIPGWIKGAFEGVTKIITAPYKAAFNAIAKLWNNTVGKLKFKIPGWIPGIGGKGFDVPNIPEFDLGGIMPGRRGAPGLALLHGGETVLPTHRTAAGPTFQNTFNIVSSDPFRAGMSAAQALRDAAYLMGA